MAELIFPKGYSSPLDIRQTEAAIKYVKDTFERTFAQALKLERISAPLFVLPKSGLNDNLNGVERPVSFDIKDMGEDVEIVHSLAKWKRMALKQYGFGVGEGLYTDMDAIRRDEELDNLHSVYVDQWDWEKVISADMRTMAYLEGIVRQIVRALAATELATCAAFAELTPKLCPDVTFITTQELEDKYPELTPKQREDAIAKECRTVFISQIGGLLKSGAPHDGRAPDYDDWMLNGDIIVWNDLLERSFELSSMGIRVDEAAMHRQLEAANCQGRRSLDFHSRLLAGELPLTIGGGIGQSRMCMLILQKVHIGEVQVSAWSEGMRASCEIKGIHLL